MTWWKFWEWGKSKPENDPIYYDDADHDPRTCLWCKDWDRNKNKPLEARKYTPASTPVSGSNYDTDSRYYAPPVIVAAPVLSGDYFDGLRTSSTAEKPSMSFTPPDPARGLQETSDNMASTLDRASDVMSGSKDWSGGGSGDYTSHSGSSGHGSSHFDSGAGSSHSSSSDSGSGYSSGYSSSSSDSGSSYSSSDSGSSSSSSDSGSSSGGGGD